MLKSRPPYSPEPRRQPVELVSAGRDPEDLAREFDPTSQSIRNWVLQADRTEGRREEAPLAALSAAERDELARLRHENKQPRVERDICKPGPGLLQHSGRGNQHAAYACRRLLDEHGIPCSMSRKGTAGTARRWRASSAASRRSWTAMGRSTSGR